MSFVLTGELLKQLAQVADRLQLWRTFLNVSSAANVAEVGVWKGEFTAQILRDCQQIAQYHLIDPWANLPDWNKPFNVDPQQFDEIYEEAIRVTQFAEAKRVVHRGRTKEVIGEIDDNSLDFAYIDGDHTLRGITLDLTLMLSKIRPGGYLGGDDFCVASRQHDARFEPTMVCPYAVYFAEAHDLPIWALPHNQFLIHNDPNKSFAFADTTQGYSDLSLTSLLKTRRPRNFRGLMERLLGR